MLRIACIVLLAASFADATESEIAKLMQRAESGDTEAMVTLGVRYRDGEGVERDRKAAVGWYRNAVDAGSSDACDHLGFMYLRGWGVRRDFVEARKLFEKAGEHPQALYNLGRIYDEGLGVEIDKKRSAQYWEKSARLGNRHAPLSIGLREWHRSADPDMNIVGRNVTSAVDRDHPIAGRWVGYLATSERERSRDRASNTDATRDRLRAYDRQYPTGDPERTSLETWHVMRHRKQTPGRFVFYDLPHRTQGLNMCAPTAAAIAMSSDTERVDPYDIKAKCEGSPRGTGTDWALLVDAIRAHGRKAEIATFPRTDAGFAEAAAALRAELDAGRPALVDVIEPSRESDSAHTVVAVGYDKDAGRWILHDPAAGPPGLWVLSDERFKTVWHSRWWTKTSTGFARPMIRISR